MRWTPLLTIAAVFASVAGPTEAQSVAKPKVRIVLVGDSTVTEDSGWGAGFRHLAAAGTEVVNLAANGRSSKSYIVVGRMVADALRTAVPALAAAFSPPGR